MEWLSNLLVVALVGNIDEKEKGTIKEPQLLKTFTKPLTDLIVKLDSKVLDQIAQGIDTSNKTLAIHECAFNSTKKCIENFLFF